MALKASAGSPAYAVTVLNPSGGPTPLWITATPENGRLPVNLSVRVNPTGLAVGSYSASISVSSTGSGGVAIPVSLVISQPLPSLVLSRTAVSFAAPSWASSDSVILSTTGGPISYTASLSNVTWLNVNPSSGYILPGAPAVLTLRVDASGLSPQAAPYVGKVTLAATGVASSSKAQTITVSLTVNSIAPSISGSLWPSSTRAGSPNTTVTIRGSGFYAGTTVRVAPQGSTAATTITPTVLSSTVLMAVLPASLLAKPQILDLVVSNPGGDSGPAIFRVSAAPTVQATVNLASYSTDAVSPGELVTLFGDGIGPDTPQTMVDADRDGYVDTTVGGVTVTINGRKAPLLYASANQISVQVPYEVTIGNARDVVVTSGSAVATGFVDIAATRPALFTLDGTGIGQSAALNYNPATNSYTLNTDKTPAHPGDIVVLYLTGEGDHLSSPNPRTGFLVPSGFLQKLSPPPQVMIGGAKANVAYAGPFPGSILGILQMNVEVPAEAVQGNSVPVTITIGGVSTQPGVTLAIHQ